MPEIHNPNLQTQGPGGGGSGGDLRSTMFFMLLVFIAFLGYQYFFNKPKPEQPGTQTQQQSTQAGPQAATGSAMANAPPVTAGKTQAQTQAQAAATPTIAAEFETETTVENELYKIVFTNRGAQVKHWILKRYKNNEGKPLDLVQPEASARFGLPLALFTYEPAVTTEVNQALYQVSHGNEPMASSGQMIVSAPGPGGAAAQTEANTLTFHYEKNGLDVVKSLHFDSSYVVDVTTRVTRNGEPVRALVEWPAGLGDMEEFHQSSMLHGLAPTPSFFAWSLDNRQDTMKAAKVSGNDTLNAPYQYAAVMDLYFAAAFLPDTPEDTTVVTLHNAIPLPADPTDPNSKKTSADVLGLAVGSTSGTTHVRLFAGPKASDVLASIHAMGADGKEDGPTLESLIQFGWWTIVAKPLYLVLRFLVLHGIGNWGWAIIIFTTAFTLIMLPTRVMMTRSSLKMMRIQPKVEAIKNRYKHLKATDPKRAEMNTEMMALYKTEGVNMYGSCLPMLVQMPLFFAYFRVLENAVELRQAHWLWLPDLSAPDPTHVLPIVIIVTMFLTQYITPSPGMDPTQRKMMAFMMPVFFGFMLWHYASGLALYWGTSNVIYLAMQLGINRSSMGKEMHAIAARRAGKKLGGQGRR